MIKTRQHLDEMREVGSPAEVRRAEQRHSDALRAYAATSEGLHALQDTADARLRAADGDEENAEYLAAADALQRAREDRQRQLDALAEAERYQARLSAPGPAEAAMLDRAQEALHVAVLDAEKARLSEQDALTSREITAAREWAASAAIAERGARDRFRTAQALVGSGHTPDHFSLVTLEDASHEAGVRGAEAPENVAMLSEPSPGFDAGRVILATRYAPHPQDPDRRVVVFPDGTTSADRDVVVLHGRV